jgi:hypothetical protein
MPHALVSMHVQVGQALLAAPCAHAYLDPETIDLILREGKDGRAGPHCCKSQRLPDTPERRDLGG